MDKFFGVVDTSTGEGFNILSNSDLRDQLPMRVKWSDGTLKDSCSKETVDAWNDHEEERHEASLAYWSEDGLGHEYAPKEWRDEDWNSCDQDKFKEYLVQKMRAAFGDPGL